MLCCRYPRRLDRSARLRRYFNDPPSPSSASHRIASQHHHRSIPPTVSEHAHMYSSIQHNSTSPRTSPPNPDQSPHPPPRRPNTRVAHTHTHKEAPPHPNKRPHTHHHHVAPHPHAHAPNRFPVRARVALPSWGWVREGSRGGVGDESLVVAVGGGVGVSSGVWCRPILSRGCAGWGVVCDGKGVWSSWWGGDRWAGGDPVWRVCMVRVVMYIRYYRRLMRVQELGKGEVEMGIG